MWPPRRSVLPITFACLLVSSPQGVRAADNLPGAAPALDARGGSQLLSRTADPFSDIETAAHAMPAIKAPASVSQAPAHEPPNLAPGEVEIAQYGDYEANMAYWWDSGGFLAVRFDPPFPPPYTIKSIRFSSATTDGSQARFTSVLLCESGGPFGGPNVAAPIARIAPFAGNPDGTNEVPVGFTVSDSGQTFYACLGFPTVSGSTLPKGYPFLRMDQVDLEKGNYGNSCILVTNGRPLFFGDRNFIVSMVCELPDARKVPIESATNLGANRVTDGIDFTFTRPVDERADGTPMHRGSLLRTRLLWRTGTGPWTIVDSVAAGHRSLELPSLPNSVAFWAVQAVDKDGNGAVLSSGPATDSSSLIGWPAYDFDEPNGDLREATALAAPYGFRIDVSAPGGDKDYYTFTAGPGDLIAVQGNYTRDGAGDLFLTIVLFDGSGKEAARSEGDKFVLTYLVPQRSPRAREYVPRQYTVLITDRSNLSGSDHAPRGGPLLKTEYGWQLYVGPPRPGTRGTRPSEAAALPGVTTVTQLFDGTTKISFNIARDEAAYRWTARVFDVRGRLVRTLATESPGSNVITTTWDGRGGRGQRLARGWYFVRLDGPRRSYVARVLTGSLATSLNE